MFEDVTSWKSVLGCASSFYRKDFLIFVAWRRIERLSRIALAVGFPTDELEARLVFNRSRRRRLIGSVYRLSIVGFSLILDAHELLRLTAESCVT